MMCDISGLKLWEVIQAMFSSLFCVLEGSHIAASPSAWILRRGRNDIQWVSSQSPMTMYHDPCTKPPWVCYLKHHLAYSTDTEIGTGSGFVWYASIQFPSNMPAVFWRDWANFYTAYQKWVRMSATVQPCQKWLFSDYNLSWWNFRKWCLIVLIFLFLMTSDIVLYVY